MGYYHGEKSVGLAPIVLVLSLVFVLGFGALYTFCGQLTKSEGNRQGQTQTNLEAAPTQSHV